MESKLSIFWFRRDLRLYDNTALFKALNSGNKVIPVFIFDENILDKLPKNDARVNFIYNCLQSIQEELQAYNTSILVKIGELKEIWKSLLTEFSINKVFFNKDYEPYALQRDEDITSLLKERGIEVFSYKDQVIFEESEILKNDDTPYTVYTPYKKKWLLKFQKELHTKLNYDQRLFVNFYKYRCNYPSLKEIGFTKSAIKVKPYNLSLLSNYDETRDYPSKNTTSYLSPHLRFGTVSIRQMVAIALKTNAIFLSELIWREFFMQILYHFPQVVTQNFKKKYDALEWRNNEEEFKKWCNGETGYPLVDAGMRELNETGYMHNRVRMITASFLCKHLLIDWRWGEAYFASKLLDYELAANNGNWQWAASTGCDAVPYFRIFNPTEQLRKFDKNLLYTKKWVKNLEELSYPLPIVEHKYARERALQTFKKIG
ncbi:deoxyribodipyrimidine photo-lyase [Tenacibaculum sp. 190524A02b]|uniref:cryptochrome/photolyase family protein n=1 Tax=Tenacibaculum vairaonense TaxID=3137860 RepID=UPI0031FAC17F